ncbi:MAG: hypothetical protein ABFC57_18490 [Veillonellales bacterium]
MNINYFQDQYDMVNECKDPEVKKMQLEVLANNMDQTYNIPADKDEKYAQENPYVMKLYNKVAAAKA